MIKRIKKIYNNFVIVNDFFSIEKKENKYLLSLEKTFRINFSSIKKDYEICKNNLFFPIKKKIPNFKIEKNVLTLLVKNKKNKSFDSLLTQDTSEENGIIKLPDTPKGLQNFSLNCYMNSLLQCFYHIKGLRTSFIDPSKYSKKTQQVCYSLCEVMNGLTYGNNKNYSPNNFKSTLGKINSLFAGHKGADVSDLYRTVVDSIINEISYEYPEEEDEDDDGDNTNKNQYYKNAKKEVDENNPIIKEFNYFFETIYKCPKGNKCYSMQNDTSIMFELLKIAKWANTDKIDLKKCFEYNFRTIEKNEFFCSKCNDTHVNKSKDKILSLPKVLALILNRGKGKQFVNKIKFYEKINIQRYVDDEYIDTDNRKYNYKLIGVSTHMGSSSDYGHYIAYCYREAENKYFCFNDTSVSEVKFKDLNNEDPYILFYEQIDELIETM